MSGDPHHGGPLGEGPVDPFRSTGSWFGDDVVTPSSRRSWSPDDPPSPPMTPWRWLAPFLLITAGFALATRLL